MLQPNKNALVFEHKVEIPPHAAQLVWQAWNALANWPQWDVSLRAVDVSENGLELGKRFSVVPKAASAPIPVNVTSFEEGRHFTTSSVSSLGMLSFGHSLFIDQDNSSATVTHSICVVPTNDELFPEVVWSRLKSDVVESVNTLAKAAIQGV